MELGLGGWTHEPAISFHPALLRGLASLIPTTDHIRSAIDAQNGDPRTHTRKILLLTNAAIGQGEHRSGYGPRKPSRVCTSKSTLLPSRPLNDASGDSVWSSTLAHRIAWAWLIWKACGMDQMSFSGGWSSGVLGNLGWVGGTMEVCSRSGSVRSTTAYTLAGTTRGVVNGEEKGRLKATKCCRPCSVAEAPSQFAERASEKGDKNIALMACAKWHVQRRCSKRTGVNASGRKCPWFVRNWRSLRSPSPAQMRHEYSLVLTFAPPSMLCSLLLMRSRSIPYVH